MARRKRRKSRNPESAFMEYAIIAGGIYLLYRLIKTTGLLGGNGDYDKPYVPSPVVEKVKRVVKQPVVYGPTDPLRTVRSAYGEYQKTEVVNKSALDAATKEVNRVNAALVQARLQRQNAIKIKQLEDELKGKQNIQYGAATEYRKQMTSAEKSLLASVSKVVETAQADPSSIGAAVAQQKYDPKVVDDFIKAAALVVGQGPVVTSE